MFRIWLTNFGWFANLGEAIPTLSRAKLEAQRIGYESVIYGPNGPVLSYSILGGFARMG